MNLLANVAVCVVIALHGAFLVLEMFVWKTPAGQRMFGLTPEFAERSASLAANQGLYNGFLAAGLVWSLFAEQGGFALKLFFLSCVVIAGIFGGITAKRSILWMQALPGAIALALVLATR